MTKINSSTRAGYLLLGIIFSLVFVASASWPFRTGLALILLGIFLFQFNPTTEASRYSRVLVWGMIIFSLIAYFPANFVGKTAWRIDLEELGVITGDLNIIQWEMAMEHHAVYVLFAIAALVVSRLRFSSDCSFELATVFVVGVAFYAIVAKLSEGQLSLNRGFQTFGFFPNRNHNSNFLSLGFVCGLGGFFQAIRSKQFIKMAILFSSIAIIVWAIFSWNISRSGIVLCVLGSVLWCLGLGRHYLGRNELKALSLIILLMVGIFSLNEFELKKRLTKNFEDVLKTSSEDPLFYRSEEIKDVNFRGLLAFDAFELIQDFPLTGVGSGQFRWVFPQYRDLTAHAYRYVAAHPESSWLWLAAEWGLPSVFCLLGLAIVAYTRGYRNIRKQGYGKRSLRLGLLVASALVPLHSFFDVSAHRPSLLLTSILLFALSQNQKSNQLSLSGKTSKFSRVATGVCLIGFGLLFLGGDSSFGWRKPISAQSAEDLAQGHELYKKAEQEARSPNPLASLSTRKKVIDVMGEISRNAPLDGRLYRLRGLASLPLIDLKNSSERDFKIDRALLPFSPRIPMIHAASSLPYNNDEVYKGWKAALENADQIDEIQGHGTSERDLVVGEIRAVVKTLPNFNGMMLDFFKPKTLEK